ncbi:MAG TPA: hypothetical protein VNX65_04250 [Patescibacteria group bacterium]|jgi:hypothetical protein|nr:hypothetical protein [Patescibacteria group bacterium]
MARETDETHFPPSVYDALVAGNKLYPQMGTGSVGFGGEALTSMLTNQELDMQTVYNMRLSTAQLTGLVTKAVEGHRAFHIPPLLEVNVPPYNRSQEEVRISVADIANEALRRIVIINGNFMARLPEYPDYTIALSRRDSSPESPNESTPADLALYALWRTTKQTLTHPPALSIATTYKREIGDLYIAGGDQQDIEPIIDGAIGELRPIVGDAVNSMLPMILAKTGIEISPSLARKFVLNVVNR